MAASKTVTVKVEVTHPDVPHATFDGGVWHCEGRLVTLETAKSAYEEALFWLAIHKAEQQLQETKATK